VAGPILQAVLVDVGGTLWPNSWPINDADRVARLDGVARVIGGQSALGAEALIAAITERVDEGQAPDLDAPPQQVIGEALVQAGLPSDAPTIRAVRQALCADLGSQVSPLAGARELLEGIRRLGLRCVIVSNTMFRDAEVYDHDFRTLGWGGLIDGCVTSVDVGQRKPDRRMFDTAIEMAAVAPESCVMIGDSEDADIVPAVAMGMRAIRVTIEDPGPRDTEAQAIVSSLAEVLEVLRSWS
jgi:HAD superfamily hydrolase (TIGR01509 family)